MKPKIAKHYHIKGVVQGVGFRPFVYKLACENSLCGFVQNGSDGVVVELEGDREALERFEIKLIQELPPLARIDFVDSHFIEPKNFKHFEIIQSDASHAKSTLVSPDVAVCKDCLRDIKSGRFKGYFATNCTNCGPRYSIIKTLPYDRANTSMSDFTMCAACEKEYNDPSSRRYHAQPISCPNCGPQLALTIQDELFMGDDDAKFEQIAQLLKEGKIGAIKGVGGFHIVCDAMSDEAILRLREAKNRPSKPFAIMCKELEQVQNIASVNVLEEELLCSKEAPIVILKKCRFSYLKLSKYLAPNIDRIGCMLAYTPLHHLLFRHVKMPIVATSANLGDEPIITNSHAIKAKLPFVEFILDFDREIVNGVDDSLVQVVGERVQTLRLGRGYAPKVLHATAKERQKILAVGANQKSSIAFLVEDNIILSPHIGDLDSIEAFGYFERTVETFKRFYDFEPELIVHDKHPSYLSTKWALSQNPACESVGHHLAHIYACKAEHNLGGEYLGFSFDGTGYGDDATLWGGEVFVGDERKYHFKPVALLGGERAIKEPRRVALAMLFEKLSLDEVLACELECVKSFSHAEIKILHQSFLKGLNAPRSSSVGRLFDAVASLAHIAEFISYEGESGLLCESYYDEDIEESFAYKIINGEIEMDVVAYILTHDSHAKEICSMFINTLVKIVVDIAKKEKKEVILSGGVFQNRTLLENLACEFEKDDIRFYFQEKTPINDGGIALGQLHYILQKSSKNI